MSIDRLTNLQTTQSASVRKLKYKEALEEAYLQCMSLDDSIFIAGIGVDYSGFVFGSMQKIVQKFGAKRIFDTPAMENGLTGIAIGAAAMGKRPVIVHLRNDFMFLAFDQMINLAAKWKYMYGGNSGSVPIVIRAIVGKGWGQGATHSQSLHTVLGYFPGLKVVMPAFPQDAKGLTIAALQENCPVVILEHRSLYETTGFVSFKCEPIEIGKANIVRKGTDITLVSVSYMVRECIIAAEALSHLGISVEVLDLRSVRPLDEQAIIDSLKNTGNMMVVDCGWKKFGITSEVAAICAEKGFTYLKNPVKRLSWPDCPLPVSAKLENAFYPNASTISKEIMKFFGQDEKILKEMEYVDNFEGPY